MQPSGSGHVVIAGGSGFLGLNLARFLSEHGRHAVVLSRSAPACGGPWTHVPWDGRTVGDWASTLEGAEALVNLAGRTVDCVKTPDHCDEILRSRVESTRALGHALSVVEGPPPCWVQMSTAHLYGDPPRAICDEDSAFGHGLAPTVGQAWEKACTDTCPGGVRLVFARTSFVLGRSGGALQRLAGLARWGLGGKVGNGRQGISWIHEHDMNRFMLRAIEDGRMQGPYLATAPNPVSNAEFMASLRRALRVPIGLPAPSVLVRIGAPLVMSTDPELALYGRYCVSRRLRELGFDFEFPDLDEALKHLMRRPSKT